ncbi:MBL fold metallo-hydrolase [Phenylobacterium montanum]|uniref:MBL fold metallo-hydrolase n=1 Tax=Phenylobacterium montanum TaxID=2823693 RepID=A0A975ISW8_9CAUL|nr:MBL fold metallo-hydrolase [Caulobacter sp. S6]QUD86163.1 MBL fold metallo-hydrolase [Caulobacter sp. S6]
MADGIERGARERDGGEEDRRPALVYPLENTPDYGQAVDIAPGVKWMRMPLGGSLAFINVWAIEDDGGWAIVDTGMQTKDTSQAWRKVFSEALGGAPITRVFVTHLHPDHVGLAGWITRKFSSRVWMTRLEYLQCRMLVADTGREAPQDAIEFYRGCGWDEEALETYRARFGGFGKGVYQLPDSYHRIKHGDEIRIGAQTWRVVTGSGHSPEHACLYCPELKLFISGDQVLPKISSNVSVFPTEPDGDPLSDWLSSLARIKTLVPDDVLVLPAHNDPFIGLHARLDHLIRGHERGLDRLEKTLAEPRRAIDVFGALFARKINGDLLGMATGESMAHLNCLRTRGRATATRDDQGVVWWQAAG